MRPDPQISERMTICMSEVNKHNILYFESPSMRGLYDCMDEWQHVNQRRLLSVSIQKDGKSYCCIALTNPTEVVITSYDGAEHADVGRDGHLRTTEYPI